ncbi:MAG: hypothetical protein NTX66_00080 [Candidatus Falkowbacteria bacterium]|nr:hypothetical protein [Candidatus Falkowbacteria bacterium]
MARSKSPDMKLRRRRRNKNIIYLLNANINELNELSVNARAALNKLGLETLAQFARELKDNKLPLNEFGLKAREELSDVFKKNKIRLPANWIWGLQRPNK